MKTLISTENAIKTTWMILEGLGYSKSGNSDLEKTVEKVFASCPVESGGDDK